jgi:hypothetical protein
MAKKKYSDRTDIEKLQSQWNKITGLLVREEPSAAIIRCATAAEIAANIAIRSVFSEDSEFTEEQVDTLLIWANGLRGKMDHLLLPFCFRNNKKNRTYKILKASADKINTHRNSVAHQGSFSSRNLAKEVIAECKTFITTLVPIYEPGFQLEES